MLAGSNRLKKKKDFEQAFKRGKGFKEAFLSVKFIENNLKATRFGFIVGQKISKKAVLRNKVKRRLRELVKAKLGEIKKGLDIVLIVGKGLEIKNITDTEEIFNRLFKKAKLFND